MAEEKGGGGRKRGREETKDDDDVQQEGVLEHTQRVLARGLAQDPETQQLVPLLGGLSPDPLKIVLQYINLRDFVMMQAALADQPEDQEWLTQLFSTIVELRFTRDDAELIRDDVALARLLTQVAPTARIVHLGDCSDYVGSAGGFGHFTTPISPDNWRRLLTLPHLTSFTVDYVTHGMVTQIDASYWRLASLRLETVSLHVNYPTIWTFHSLLQTLPSTLRHLSLSRDGGNFGNVVGTLCDLRPFPELTHLVVYTLTPVAATEWKKLTQVSPRLQVVRYRASVLPEW